MLSTRILTALVLIPLVLAAMFGLQTAHFALVLLVVIAVGAAEWAALAGWKGVSRWGLVIATLVAAGALLYVADLRPGKGWRDAVVVPVCGLATIFWVLIVPPWLRHRWRLPAGLPTALLGGAILVAAWVALVQLHARSPWALLAAMAIVWIADTAAYFSGRAFGRRKLAPQISPGKSWEGVYGGIAAVALYALLLTPNVREFSPGVDAVAWVLLAMMLAALSVVGDLFESLLKRQAGVKDSGRILPGHGGVLDRVDALLSAMPAAALALQVMQR
jgi:phosphatidate cytidylyltransferase